jgi:hypothetical protein
MKKTAVLVICVFMCLGLVACNLLGNSSKEIIRYEPTFTYNGWVFHNVHPSVQRYSWTRLNEPEETIFLGWSLRYSGNQIPVGDIVSFSIHSGAAQFSIPLEVLKTYPSENYSGQHIIYTDYIWGDSNFPHALPLGPWTYDFSLKNGQSFSYTATYTRPGTNEIANPGDLLFTEDYQGSTVYPMVKRASIQGISIDPDAGRLTCSFTIKDSNTYSGWLYMFDERGADIGSTKRFVSAEGEVSDELAGLAFDTNGELNTLTALAENYPDLELTPSKFYFAFITTIDGAQFSNTTSAGGFDNRTRSEVAPIIWNPPPPTGGLLVRIKDPALAGMWARARVYDSEYTQLARSNYFKLDYTGMGYRVMLHIDGSGQNRVFYTDDELQVSLDVWDDDDNLLYDASKHVVINGPTTLEFFAIDNEL